MRESIDALVRDKISHQHGGLLGGATAGSVIGLAYYLDFGNVVGVKTVPSRSPWLAKRALWESAALQLHPVKVTLGTTYPPPGHRDAAKVERSHGSG